jgi:NAD(P) transhydrogenase
VKIFGEGQWCVTLADGRCVRISLYAAGRNGNVGSLGLETVGIEAA